MPQNINEPSPTGITIGCTANLFDRDKIHCIAEADYDYIETNLSMLAEASEKEAAAFAAELESAGIPCLAANFLFPPSHSMRLTGPIINGSLVADYLERAFSRAAKIGIKTVSFGAGSARRVPDGFSPDEALEQLRDLCVQYIAPAAEKYDLTVAVENINENETNILCRVAEVSDFVAGIGSDRIRVLCSNYHMVLEGEDYTVIRKIGRNIAHVHVTSPTKRSYPTVNDPHDYSDFFDSLRYVGYKGGITVEVGVPDDENTEENIYASSIFLRTVI